MWPLSLLELITAGIEGRLTRLEEAVVEQCNLVEAQASRIADLGRRILAQDIVIAALQERIDGELNLPEDLQKKRRRLTHKQKVSS